MLAFEAGIIHRDISEGNVMIATGRGFLHDFDYGFNWQDVLKKSGWEVSEASWKRYVGEYDSRLPHRMRPAPPEQEIPMMAPMNEDNLKSSTERMDTLREEWLARMKVKERTVRLMRSLSPSFLG